MSNLGKYQWITLTSKKVGGPTKLLALVAAGGYIVFRTTEVLVKKLYFFLNNNKCDFDECTITVDYVDNDFEFISGEKIKVIGIDGDTVIVAKTNSEKEVHAMLLDDLLKISDYKLSKEDEFNEAERD